MKFSIREMQTQESYRLITRALVPRPIAWITTLTPTGGVNLAPFSAYTLVCPQPLMIGFTVGPKKDTAKNIAENGEFVVNVPNFALLDAMHLSSQEFPSEVSETAELNIETIPSELVAPPRIKAAPVQMECRVHKVHEHGEFATKFVVGEVLLIHVDDNLVSGKTAKFDFLALDPIGVMGGGTYFRIGETFKRPPVHGDRNPWGRAFASEDQDE